MAFWKQSALALLLIAVAFLAFARLYPEADKALASLGMEPAMVRLATGAGADKDAGPQAARDGANRGPGNQGQGQAQGQAQTQGQGPAQGQRQGQGPGQRQTETLVQTDAVRLAKINDRITAIGDGAALRSVVVVPLSSGIVTEVTVSAGARVEKGDVLARLDSGAEEVARDRAKLAVQTARNKLDRTQRLASSRAATEVAVADAEVEVATAELELREAELALERRSVVAPISGIVGIVAVEPGAFVTTQTEIATIDDRSQIIVDFWVPERFAASIQPGQEIKAAPVALPGERFQGSVEAVGSRIERESRTLQIRALIENPEDVLRPGMSFRVEMAFPGDEFPSVNPLAIQWSSSGPFVWKVQEGKAQRTAVRVVQRNSDAVLVQAALTPGEEVVTEGVQSLREGSALRIAGSGAANRPRQGG